MCLAQGPQRSDAGEARTRGPLSQVKHSTTEQLRMRERERERERERCVFFLNFIFFNSENSTYFKVSCLSLQKILINEVSLKWHLPRWRASEKRFGFLKEERKCSDWLNKWTFTTCK